MVNDNVGYLTTAKDGKNFYPVADWNHIDNKPDFLKIGGFILTSPNGQQYKLGVDDNGRLTTTKVIT